MSTARRRTEHGGEAGTASMEALLCLPFVFLILALCVNLGSGWIDRLRADAAVRYAGTLYVRLLSQGVEEGVALRVVEEALQRDYYPGVAMRLAIDGRGANLEGSVDEHGGDLGGAGAILDNLAALGELVSSRHQVYLNVPRKVPTGTLLPETPLQVEFFMDGNTWTYAEIPLSFSALTDVGQQEGIGLGLLSRLFDGIFWLLGMRA